MKQLVILSMSLFFALTVSQANAQENIKKDIKQAKKEIKDTRKDKKEVIKEPRASLKEQRRELRSLRGKLVSEQTKSQFNVDFGNLSDVKWERTKDFDKATFTKDGQIMTAYYDIDAQLVGTTSPKMFADLPAKSQKKINTKYKDYTIGQVIYFDENENYDPDYMVLYNTPFEHLDHYFVELSKDSKRIILIVTKEGDVSIFREL
ncbi:hypothetical protein [uncultured Acetobacteroides sp.]|uniref:hypothetical protein n=1 Tax=uncultured Acetobacteroides sp. TaxID=1760811 RepID=UPI0029F5B39D|nr:hypothetical protein [uncultured Acetobacteroides sp.]